MTCGVGPKGGGGRRHEHRNHCVFYAWNILKSESWLMVGRAYHPFSLYSLSKVLSWPCNI